MMVKQMDSSFELKEPECKKIQKPLNDSWVRVFSIYLFYLIILCIFAVQIWSSYCRHSFSSTVKFSTSQNQLPWLTSFLQINTLLQNTVNNCIFAMLPTIMRTKNRGTLHWASFIYLTFFILAFGNPWKWLQNLSTTFQIWTKFKNSIEYVW